MSREDYATTMDILRSSIAVTAAKRGGGEESRREVVYGWGIVMFTSWGIFQGLAFCFGASWGLEVAGT